MFNFLTCFHSWVTGGHRRPETRSANHQAAHQVHLRSGESSSAHAPPPRRSHRRLVAGHGDVCADSANVPHRGTGLHLNPCRHTRASPSIHCSDPPKYADARIHAYTHDAIASCILLTLAIPLTHLLHLLAMYVHVTRKNVAAPPPSSTPHFFNRYVMSFSMATWFVISLGCFSWLYFLHSALSFHTGTTTSSGPDFMYHVCDDRRTTQRKRMSTDSKNSCA